MKKVLKILGIILGVLVLLIGGTLMYFNVKGIPSYEVKAPDLKVIADSALIARGEYIVSNTCINCHRGKDGKLSGKFLEDSPGFGKFYAPNITQHPTAGIGSYTDGELAYLLRTGVRKSGKITLPVMSRFPHMSDYDIQAIIAYLRSDNTAVQASEQVQPASEPALLAKVLMNLVIKPLPYPSHPIEVPSTSNQAAYGEYLADGVINCFHCHSARFDAINELEPEKSEGYYGGGNQISNPAEPDQLIYSANLTMHPEHGLGNWTEEEFIKAVKSGQRNNGTGLRPAMPTFPNMTDEDAKAIWAYLKTVPVLDNPVDRGPVEQ
ncbi:MAG: c-type cytochrome [Phaeodactylibacter sp.]|nr:c-type cytochrome [Phaeodactylibacter sp.]